LELFDDLTVEDNLRVGAERQGVGSFIADVFHPARRRHLADIEQALHLLGIADLAQRMPNEISQGQRKLIGVARALAARPRLLCMDEPAAGLDTAESQRFAARLRMIRDAGTTVLLIDHDMGLVLNVCDYVHVMEFGVKIAEGTPRQITNDARVIESYLGAAAVGKGQR
jgi:branched-chain amino acid transport system ATP-binding protein